jgi:hypothetical protein
MAVELVWWQSRSCDGSHAPAMAVELVRWKSHWCNGSRTRAMAVALVWWQSSSCDGSRARVMAVELVWWQSSLGDGCWARVMTVKLLWWLSLCKSCLWFFSYYITLSIQNLLGQLDLLREKSICIEHLATLTHSRYERVELDVEFIFNILIVIRGIMRSLMSFFLWPIFWRKVRKHHMFVIVGH